MIDLIKKWAMKKAKWWEFWLPQSISGGIVGIVVGGWVVARVLVWGVEWWVG